MQNPLPNRALVKLSGERLGGDGTDILDVAAIRALAQEIVTLHDAGVETAVVLGGGNILRGKEVAQSGIEEAQAHQMGMLATIINALAFQSELEHLGKTVRVMSALNIADVAEPYIRRRAERHLEKGRIVVLAAGTGNAFFSTDSAGALRAIELNCDLLVKATKVDGIYTTDPMQHTDAQHLPELTYKEVLVGDLKVMDGSAIALCRDNNMPLMVCKVDGAGSLLAAVKGEVKRTVVG